MRQWIERHRVEFLLFVLLWVSYAYFYQSTRHNEAARFDQMRALISDRTLEIKILVEFSGRNSLSKKRVEPYLPEQGARHRLSCAGSVCLLFVLSRRIARTRCAGIDLLAPGCLFYDGFHGQPVIGRCWSGHLSVAPRPWGRQLFSRIRRDRDLARHACISLLNAFFQSSVLRGVSRLRILHFV